MKKRPGSLVKYTLSSGICFLLDYGLFTLLNALVLRSLADGLREVIATYGARVVSAAVNFLLNRNVVFRDRADPRRSALRYAALAVAQAAASALLVALIRHITGSSPLMETVIKIPVDVGLFFASYGIQKKWVFRDGNKPES
ncbi:MAG: GtrA family protein [Oscillospiraceae bacterium]|nr:GtrA family protein [Oscillospiraceae bacterium]